MLFEPLQAELISPSLKSFLEVPLAIIQYVQLAIHHSLYDIGIKFLSSSSLDGFSKSVFEINLKNCFMVLLINLKVNNKGIPPLFLDLLSQCSPFMY
jgi:hypothetical protein